MKNPLGAMSERIGDLPSVLCPVEQILLHVTLKCSSNRRSFHASPFERINDCASPHPISAFNP